MEERQCGQGGDTGQKWKGLEAGKHQEHLKHGENAMGLWEQASHSRESCCAGFGGS